MGNLLFSFGGRINAADFQRGAIVLIGVGVAFNILPLLSAPLGMIFGVLGIVLIWPWIAIWTKRYHDAGKSGWMFLVPFVVMIVLSQIGALVVNMIAPIDTSAVEAAAANGDIMEIMKGSFAAAKGQIVPNTIMGAIVSFAVVYVFNGMIKSDPEENQFGPATK